MKPNLAWPTCTRFHLEVTRGRVELPCLAARRSERRVSACFTTWSSVACGSCTRPGKLERLPRCGRSANVPKASPAGLEPAIFAVTGRRALQAAPRGRITFPNSPGWSRTSVAWMWARRRSFGPRDRTHARNSGGWSRTNGLLVQSQASLPAATAPEQFLLQTPHHPQGSGRTIRTSIAWFKARQPTISRSPSDSYGGHARKVGQARFWCLPA